MTTSPSPTGGPSSTASADAESSLSVKTAPLGVSLMIALCSALLLGIMGWSVGGWQQTSREEAVLVQARALAAGVALVDTSTEEGEAILQQRLLQALPLLGPVQEALVLEGTRFVAHSKAELAGTRLSRDDLTHKALYDDAKALQESLERNREERKTFPDLTQNPFPVTRVKVESASVQVLVPVIAQDEMRGMLVLRSEPGGMLASSFATQVSLVGALLIGLAFGVGRLGSRRLLGLPAVGWLAAAWLLVSLQIEGSSAQMQTQVGQAARQGEAAWRVLGVDATQGSDLLGALNQDLSGNTRMWFTASAGQVQAGVEGAGAVPSSMQVAPALQVDASLAWGGVGLTFGLMGIWLGFLLLGWTSKVWEALVEHWYAYAYIAPAVLGTAMLVFGPFLFGIVLGFYTRVYSTYEFVGLQNFIQILSDFNLTANRNFYRTLGVTVMWTVINVSLHVGIGLGLALILKDKSLKFTALYRTLLVIPWALPNYITALIWKGMFNKEYGAVNAFLTLLGGEPVSWFNSFSGAFFANLVTNVWLGFPFMMVVSLGALQSIPTELYEAADVDGAGAWDKFTRITLPLLKPALFPAIILGVIWTFNQFNVIYLVSGGAPDGETDILITEAYRWAFEGRQQYGFAAAYSTIIFLILFGYTFVTNKLTKSTEGAYA